MYTKNLSPKTEQTQCDARIVHTVRNLKNMSSRASDNSDDVVFDRKSSDVNNIELKTQLKLKINKEKLNSNINDYSTGRISIDGSGQSTSDSANHLIDYFNKDKDNLLKYKKNSSFGLVSNTSNNPNILKKKSSFTNSNSNNFNAYKTKSEFQKRLMSENNLLKYKSMCVGLLKEDEEIKRLSHLLHPSNINNTSSLLNNSNKQLETFIEDNLFQDKFFLHNLENLLCTDVSKQRKEIFFKEEIKKIIELKVLDIKYESKMKELNIKIDNHIQNIQNFEFFS